MRASSDNPPDNNPGQGTTDDLLEAAVLKSGYPLQRIVAAQLKNSFTRVTEEWSYVDRATEEQRALDVYGFKALRPEIGERARAARAYPAR
jgi:hypothetical protein